MSAGAIEQFLHNGNRVQIFQDEDGVNPRTDWEPFGVFVDWHRRDNVGDRKITEAEKTALDLGGWDGLLKHLSRNEGATVVLPVCLLDHSGWHVYTTSPGGNGHHWSDAAGWDSGIVGFIYDSKASRDLTGVTPENAKEQLEGEIATLDSYFRGECYGYVISKPETIPASTIAESVDADFEEIDMDAEADCQCSRYDGCESIPCLSDDSAWVKGDSCWGFLGSIAYCRDEARAAAD